MRLNIRSYFVHIFCVCTLWCGEPEKTPEAPKVEIPQSIRTALENYDKQVEIEKQKYLTLMQKMQTELKTKLEMEVKTATRNKKDDLVTVLTDKLKELDENKVEVGFLGMGFPGEAKKLNKKILEDILSSKCWTLKEGKKNEIECWIFKNGLIKHYITVTELEEKNGVVKEKVTIQESGISNTKYLIDVEKQTLIFSAWGVVFSFSIDEKAIACISSNNGRYEDVRNWILVPYLNPTPFSKVLPKK